MYPTIRLGLGRPPRQAPASLASSTCAALQTGAVTHMRHQHRGESLAITNRSLCDFQSVAVGSRDRAVLAKVVAACTGLRWHDQALRRFSREFVESPFFMRLQSFLQGLFSSKQQAAGFGRCPVLVPLHSPIGDLHLVPCGAEEPRDNTSTNEQLPEEELPMATTAMPVTRARRRSIEKSLWAHNSPRLF